MNLAFCTPTYPGVAGVGGIGTYTKTLGEALVAIGHRVDVLVTGGSGPERELTTGGVRVRSLAASRIRGVDTLAPGCAATLPFALALRRFVETQAIDVVELPNWDGLGVLAPVLSRAPVSVRLHTSAADTMVVEGKPMTRQLGWEIRRERWQSRLAKALVTHSKSHAAATAEHLGLPSHRIHVIPHGVPVYRDHRRSETAPVTQTVVFVGRLEKRKGVLDLLHAATRVIDSAPETEFLLIGEDRPFAPGGRRYEQYASDELPAAVRRRVAFRGVQPQDAVDAALQQAAVFVAPSLYESFGLVFPEAMRWGAPVVGTRVGGVPEVVRDGETGLLVEPGRPDQLANAILRLLQAPELAHRLGRAGKADVEQRFSAERMAADVSRFYSRFVREAQSA